MGKCQTRNQGKGKAVELSRTRSGNKKQLGSHAQGKHTEHKTRYRSNEKKNKFTGEK
jgi:hypothetical protein